MLVNYLSSLSLFLAFSLFRIHTNTRTLVSYHSTQLYIYDYIEHSNVALKQSTFKKIFTVYPGEVLPKRKAQYS